ncbi:hypothetical protein BaRGS_00004267 [Batillaria attramentaria]|uniref:Uncharacterized protein n=1 Tax=Batillaria attramentaria TaxID=370345 RepID=A0ABD0LY46_9CAEN
MRRKGKYSSDDFTTTSGPVKYDFNVGHLRNPIPSERQLWQYLQTTPTPLPVLSHRPPLIDFCPPNSVIDQGGRWFVMKTFNLESSLPGLVAEPSSFSFSLPEEPRVISWRRHKPWKILL